MRRLLCVRKRWGSTISTCRRSRQQPAGLSPARLEFWALPTYARLAVGGWPFGSQKGNPCAGRTDLGQSTRGPQTSPTHRAASGTSCKAPDWPTRLRRFGQSIHNSFPGAQTQVLSWHQLTTVPLGTTDLIGEDLPHATPKILRSESPCGFVGTERRRRYRRVQGGGEGFVVDDNTGRFFSLQDRECIDRVRRTLALVLDVQAVLPQPLGQVTSAEPRGYRKRFAPLWRTLPCGAWRVGRLDRCALTNAAAPSVPKPGSTEVALLAVPNSVAAVRVPASSIHR